MRTDYKEVSGGISETAARVALAAVFFGTLIGQGVDIEVATLALLGVAAALKLLAICLEGR